MNLVYLTRPFSLLSANLSATPKHALTSNYTLPDIEAASEDSMSIMAFGCSSRPTGLNQKDCEYMSKIGSE